MQNNPKDEIDNNKDKRELGFWRFDEKEVIVFDTPFPKDRTVSSKEMEFVNQKLFNRISKYKNSSCFNYLQGYHDFYIKTIDSKNNEELEHNSNNSMLCLKLFALCYQHEEKPNMQNLIK